MFNLIKIIIKYVFNMFSNPEINNNNTNNLLKYVNNNVNNNDNNNILYTELKVFELKVFELNLEDAENYYSDEDIAKYK
jgi:hypothetical protein